MPDSLTLVACTYNWRFPCNFIYHRFGYRTNSSCNLRKISLVIYTLRSPVFKKINNFYSGWYNANVPDWNPYQSPLSHTYARKIMILWNPPFSFCCKVADGWMSIRIIIVWNFRKIRHQIFKKINHFYSGWCNANCSWLESPLRVPSRTPMPEKSWYYETHRFLFAAKWQMAGSVSE